MDIQKIVQGYITAQIADKVGKKFGLSSKQAKALMAVIVPVVLTAMAKNAGKGKDQAASLTDAIQNDHDGSIFSKLDLLGSESEKSDGAKILQHVLGGQSGNIVEALAKSQGVTNTQAGSVMETVAPLIMGALGKEQSKQSLGADAVLDMFAGHESISTQQKAQNPLMSLLDQDGDGSSTDDILSMGMKALKNFGKK